MRKSKNNANTKDLPALSPEARENQMISFAVNLAEQKLRDGSAATPIIVHYLKLGTMKSQLEMEKLRQENELLKAKTQAINTAEKNDVLYSQALEAFRSYRGSD